MITIRLKDERDTLKMLRETLAHAQTGLSVAHDAAAVARGGMTDAERVAGFERHLAHLARLDRVIAEIDSQRPLGPDGTHGDRHTVTCGCDVSVSESTGHVWPCTRFYVSATTADECTCWKGRG
jgi:hypothetical protein